MAATPKYVSSQSIDSILEIALMTQSPTNFLSGFGL